MLFIIATIPADRQLADGSDVALYLAAVMWLLLIILPIVLRRFFPAPDEAYEVDIDELSQDWQTSRTRRWKRPNASGAADADAKWQRH